MKSKSCVYEKLSTPSFWNDRPGLWWIFLQMVLPIRAALACARYYIARPPRKGKLGPQALNGTCYMPARMLWVIPCMVVASVRRKNAALY